MKVRQSPLKQPGQLIWFQRMPWLTLLLVAAIYLSLGWELSSFPYVWRVVAHGGGILIAVVVIWSDRFSGKLFRLGPRSVMSMLALSMLVTLAVVASSLLAMVLMLIASKFLTLVEMRTVGFSRPQIFVALILVAALGLTAGSYIHRWFPSNNFWLFG